MSEGQNNIDIQNPAKFEAMFKQHYSLLYHAAYRVVNNREAAEDIVQDLFSKMWQRRDELVIKISVKSYLYRAAVNFSINYLKTRRGLVKIDDEHGIFNELLADDVEDEMNYSELSKKVDKVINILPPVCRTVFMMSRYDGNSYKEIAETLGISVKTVENHIVKALKIFKKYIQKQD